MTRYDMGGFLAGAIAVIACPCHLPLTLPVALALTTGTAIGGWLVNNSAVVYLASTALFLGGLYLSARWLLIDETKKCPTTMKQKRVQ